MLSEFITFILGSAFTAGFVKLVSSVNTSSTNISKTLISELVKQNVVFQEQIEILNKRVAALEAELDKEREEHRRLLRIISTGGPRRTTRDS